MTREDEKYYENLFDTFATPGWKQFIEELSVGVKTLERNALYEADGQEKFNELRGRVMAMNLIVNYQAVMEKAYQSFQERDDNADL